MTFNLLFVDDENNILQGLRRMLRPMRNEWNMTFAESGSQALELMQSTKFDVVISDMKMPKMDGAIFLKEVREHSPESVRIVLSGHADEDAILRALGVAHQYIAKPCDAGALKERILSACRMRELLKQDWIKEAISKTNVIASVAESFETLLKHLRSNEPVLESIGDIVSRDVAMSARCLQVANSAFFGQARATYHPKDAVGLVGLDALKLLTKNEGAFCQAILDSEVLSLTKLNQYSLAVAKRAEHLARAEGLSAVETKAAFTSGLLHEVGRVLLALCEPNKYLAVGGIMEASGLSLEEAEREVFGATHTEIGSYLMALWGLPTEIVETIAFHHKPHLAPNPTRVLEVVHVANVLVDELIERSKEEPRVTLDHEYLAQSSKRQCLIVWKELEKAEPIQRPLL